MLSPFLFLAYIINFNIHSIFIVYQGNMLSEIPVIRTKIIIPRRRTEIINAPTPAENP